MNIPRIIITIEGGVIQGITCDQPCDVQVIDFDRKQDCDSLLFNYGCDRDTPSCYEADMAEAQKAEAEFQAERTEG